MVAKSEQLVRVAAMGDVHCNSGCRGKLQPLFEQITGSADVLALCGDLTDHGLPDEARALVREVQGVHQIPILAVLGNHDYESGHEQEIQSILTDAGITLLDGDCREIRGVGFVGVKGFGGGFGRGMLSAFGEPAIKEFVQASIDEAMKLETGLSRLHTDQRIAILHYSPIEATVHGEPPVIYPYLGSSRLEEPLNRFRVTAAIHGHAHKGAPEGKTSAGVPVYNVSIPVMREHYPDRPPFRLLDLHVKPAAPTTVPAEAPLETKVS